MTMTMSFMIMKLINIIERHNYCILLGGYAQMLIYLCWANILIIINQTISQLGYSASALHPVFSNGSRARQNSPELNFLCSVLSLQNGEMFVQKRGAIHCTPSQCSWQLVPWLASNQRRVHSVKASGADGLC